MYARLLRARKSPDTDRAWKAEAEFRKWKAFNKAGIRGVDWIPFDEWTRKQDETMDALTRDLAADAGIELVDDLPRSENENEIVEPWEQLSKEKENDDA